MTTDPIVKLGIKKNSTIYKAIQEMIELAKKDEAIRFVEWFIKYLMLENRDKYSVEQRYQLFKKSKKDQPNPKCEHTYVDVAGWSQCSKCGDVFY